MIRGVRGAITVCENTKSEIIAATQELLQNMILQNAITLESIASVFFTTTVDLTAEYPAAAARALPGWQQVPFLCAQEIPVPDGLAHCIRILIHWNTDLSQAAIRHVYLKEATALRPDLH